MVNNSFSLEIVIMIIVNLSNIAMMCYLLSTKQKNTANNDESSRLQGGPTNTVPHDTNFHLLCPISR